MGDAQRRQAPRLRHGRRNSSLAVVLAVTMTLVGAASAQAAGVPKANTGGSKHVAYNTATVAGSVNPESSATSYYFQYGPTKAYGGQSAIASAGAGDKAVSVAADLGGLQPLTVYHYRLVAVNAAGTTMGADHTFQTTKVPLSLAILASPNPVVFGGPVIVQGTLSGTDNANRQVILQINAFPFTAGFVNVGNAELTNAMGGFSFTLLGAATTAQFRVVTTTNPPIVSPVTTENVAVRVSSHIARTKRAGFARVYGSVSPAENGSQVGVLRITHGHGVLAGGTVLRAHGTTSSTFSRVVRVHKGVYRVLVRVVGAGQVSAYGQPLLIK
ncbi:MAG TPA: hypothetical protein VH061_05550 [Solirubrobacteraceae bacterium]|nr:hypothetical protein [Solirubrobacteraceae bacterium]